MSAAKVGIVLVSHSAALAAGAAELACEMAANGVPVIAVGGTADGRLGTDPDAVGAALAAADLGYGVVALGDLGSAILALRAAFAAAGDPPAWRIADAPLVEGGVAAAVMSSAGATLEEVLKSAEGARYVGKI